ncbi:MAG: hypothetical protein OXC26_02255 [Albidovulum sp.]|nr:hypothetical protein [Albidovulum sp.]
MHLLAFAREIHSPYPDLYREIAAFLHENANQDDLVFITDRSDVMPLYVGEKVIFCGKLNENSPIAEVASQAMNPVLFGKNCTPKWILDINAWHSEEFIRNGYELEKKLDVFWYPTQRPELNFHSFEPLAADAGVWIFKKP